jgi:hypothetical protein
MTGRLLPIGLLLVALQAPPVIPASFAVPEISEKDKTEIQLLAQKIEIAQLKAMLAQKDFEAARNELVSLAQRMRKDGFDLDLTNPAAPRYVKQEAK